MAAHPETPLEMERRHVREGTEHIARQEAIVSKLDRGNHSEVLGTARQLLETMQSLHDLAKARLRELEEGSNE